MLKWCVCVCSVELCLCVWSLSCSRSDGSVAVSRYAVLPGGYWWSLLYGTVILLLCLLVCLIGADIYAKATFIIFLIVMAALGIIFISFFAVKPRVIDLPNRNLSLGPTEANFTGFKLDTLVGNLQGKWWTESLTCSEWRTERNNPLNENLSSVYIHHVFGLVVGLSSSSVCVCLADYTVDYTTNVMMSFATVFAVMFNGCTGIMAGSNMSGEFTLCVDLPSLCLCVLKLIVELIACVSGDLKNPSYSIPRGTITAVIFTFVIYNLLSLLISCTCDR